MNIVPGPRSRWRSGNVKRCRLLWLYAVGADQAAKHYVWLLLFWRQCVGNGKKEAWFVLRYVGIEVFHPSRFLCGWSWLSTSSLATENILQSWLPCESDQVGAESSCSNLWFFHDASFGFRLPWSQDFDVDLGYWSFCWFNTILQQFHWLRWMWNWFSRYLKGQQSYWYWHNAA